MSDHDARCKGIAHPDRLAIAEAFHEPAPVRRRLRAVRQLRALMGLILTLAVLAVIYGTLVVLP